MAKKSSLRRSHSGPGKDVEWTRAFQASRETAVAKAGVCAWHIQGNLGGRSFVSKWGSIGHELRGKVSHGSFVCKFLCTLPIKR